MTSGQIDELFVRGAQWVPILLFHAGLYLQDPDVGYDALVEGNPLLDAVPIDVIAGFFLVMEQMCVIGDLRVDDIERLTREFSAALLVEAAPTPERGI